MIYVNKNNDICKEKMKMHRVELFNDYIRYDVRDIPWRLR